MVITAIDIMVKGMGTVFTWREVFLLAPMPPMWFLAKEQHW